MILANIVKTINYMDIFSAWHIWILLAMLLFIIEIFTPGFVLACLGIGAVGAGITSLFVDSTEIQLTVFAAICAVSYTAIRPLVLKRFFKDDNFKSNVDVLIGKRAIVSQKFDLRLFKGRVKIDGDDWLAKTETEQELKNGDVVEIVRVESNTLIVTKIQTS